MNYSKYIQLAKDIIMKYKKVLISAVAVLFIGLIGFTLFRMFNTPKQDEQFSVTLTRSGCYGTCPVYSVTLNGKGIVNYRGDNYVKVKGERIYTVNSNAVIALRDEMRKKDVFSLNDNYAQNATDLPGFTLVIHDGEKTKEIRVYGIKSLDSSIPAVLFDLADAVDTAANDSPLVVR